MKILITGATGYIGETLVKKLLSLNHHVIILARNIERAKGLLFEPQYEENLSFFSFDVLNQNPLPRDFINDLEGVFNLMGENIGQGKWTKKKKERIKNSRVKKTQELNNLLEEQLNTPLKFYFQASAVGIYQDSDQDEILDEKGILGDDFLAMVCKEWEQTSTLMTKVNRKVTGRLGVVVSPDGGMIAALKWPFKLGTGAVIGTGKQWMSWIHLEDLTRLFMELIENEQMRGTYNFTSPLPITNGEFTEVVANYYKVRKFPVAIPEFIIEMLIGEKSRLLLANQRVVPARLQEAGFEFKYQRLFVKES